MSSCRATHRVCDANRTATDQGAACPELNFLCLLRLFLQVLFHRLAVAFGLRGNRTLFRRLLVVRLRGRLLLFAHTR